MPDISMCSNEQCEFKKDCYRFTATPNTYQQSYAGFKCKSKDTTIDPDSYFWDNTAYKKAGKSRNK